MLYYLFDNRIEAEEAEEEGDCDGNDGDDDHFVKNSTSNRLSFFLPSL